VREREREREKHERRKHKRRKLRRRKNMDMFAEADGHCCATRMLRIY